MKNNYLSALTLFIILSFASVTVIAQSEKADKLKAEIEQLNEKMLKALHNDDYESIQDMYVDEVYHMPSYSPMVKGKREMMEREKESREAGYEMKSMEFDIVEVFPAGNYVVEIGKYDVTLKVPQMPQPIDDNGKYVTVWERQQDGSLKIKVETWNSDINPMAMGEMIQEQHMHKREMDKDRKHK